MVALSIQNLVIVHFAEQENQTKVAMKKYLNSVEERDEVVQKYGAVEGAKSTLNRLDDILRLFIK
ncbi:hypothetical protein [Shimazuella alba]|uniref:Uncharacterized protein n=1 Tax=Shimazuella alba TaxID=2690964 RepID=A0A6I4VMV5_9BACL|nr:hypothetical protein [Shimazuella alba]MXQ52373.1 hypothetical protein [Shimazuella alba]